MTTALLAFLISVTAFAQDQPLIRELRAAGITVQVEGTSDERLQDFLPLLETRKRFLLENAPQIEELNLGLYTEVMVSHVSRFTPKPLRIFLSVETQESELNDLVRFSERTLDWYLRSGFTIDAGFSASKRFDWLALLEKYRDRIVRFKNLFTHIKIYSDRDAAMGYQMWLNTNVGSWTLFGRGDLQLEMVEAVLKRDLRSFESWVPVFDWARARGVPVSLGCDTSDPTSDRCARVPADGLQFHVLTDALADLELLRARGAYRDIALSFDGFDSLKYGTLNFHVRPRRSYESGRKFLKAIADAYRVSDQVEVPIDFSQVAHEDKLAFLVEALKLVSSRAETIRAKKASIRSIRIGEYDHVYRDGILGIRAPFGSSPELQEAWEKMFDEVLATVPGGS